MKKKIITLLVTAAMVMSTLSGCGPSSIDTTTSGTKSADAESAVESNTSTSSSKDAIIGISSVSFSNIWDPHLDWNGWYTSRYGVTETLFKLTETLELEPWLAESYENIDENTWAITLKEGVCFSNGSPVTPEVVIANLERMAEVNYRAAYLVGATYAIDGNTITITTAEPHATMINELTDPLTSIIDLDADTDLNTSPIGTGPMQVVQLTEDTQVELSKNENYWDGEVQLDNLTVKIIGDMDTMIMALQSGEIDLAYDVSKDGLEIFSGDENFNIYTTENSRPYMIYMNMTTMTDPLVREAINQAVDKASICEYLLAGTTSPTVGPFSGKLAFGVGQLTETTFSTEDAVATLAEAGYIDTDGDGIVDKDGEPLTIRLVLYSRLSQEAIATEMQAELKNVGINCEVTVAENRDYLTNGDFDLGMYTVATAPLGDSESFLKDYVRTGGSNNRGSYSNLELDAIVDELAGEFDTEKRTELALEAQQLMLDDNAYMYIGLVNLSMVAHSYVSGFENSTSEYYYVTKDSTVNK